MSRIVAISSIMIMSIMLMLGCATLPQRLVIQPSIQTIAADNIADHQEISLRVIDLRPENPLGYLEDGHGNRQPFLATRELDMVIEKVLAAGLRKKGFIPLSGVHENNISLTVEIQQFNHRVSPGIVKVPVQTKISLRTTAVNGGRKLTSYYSIDKQAVLALRPGIQQNQRLVNEALTAVLEQIFQDQKLFNMLSLKSGIGDG
ncbi:MAG: YajG family lipoprotein [Pseudomonadota bacterium]|nr:YajG family lipoprotein [Pseudomonadota bacterium]